MSQLFSKIRPLAIKLAFKRSGQSARVHRTRTDIRGCEHFIGPNICLILECMHPLYPPFPDLLCLSRSNCSKVTNNRAVPNIETFPQIEVFLQMNWATSSKLKSNNLTPFLRG